MTERLGISSERKGNFLIKSWVMAEWWAQAWDGEEICFLLLPVALAASVESFAMKSVNVIVLGVTAGCSVPACGVCPGPACSLRPPSQLIHSAVSLEVQFCSLKPAAACFSLSSSEFFQARQLGKPGLRDRFTGFWPSQTDQNSHQKDCLCRVKFLLGKYHSGGLRRP